ncbi:MAG: hypothetical protein ABEL97_09165 [Salinibacter sp.]
MSPSSSDASNSFAPIRALVLLRRGWRGFRAHGLKVMAAYLAYLLVTGVSFVLFRVGWTAWIASSLSHLPPAGLNVDLPRLLGAMGVPTWCPTTVWASQIEDVGLSLGRLVEGSLGPAGVPPDVGAALGVWIVVAGPAAVSLYAAVLHLTREGRVSVAAACRGLRRFDTAVGTYLVAWLLQGVGLLMLIVPGLVVAAAYLPLLFRVADGTSSAQTTLAWTWTHTRGARWAFFTVYVALGALSVGPVLLYIGLRDWVGGASSLVSLVPTLLIPGLGAVGIGAYGLCVAVQGYEAVRARAN